MANAPARRTLLRRRLAALPRLPDPQGPDGNRLSGWRISDPQPDTPWRQAIMTCFQLLTAAEEMFPHGDPAGSRETDLAHLDELDFRYIYASALPLDARGQLMRDVSAPTFASGGVPYATNTGGNCAERKILRSKSEEQWQLSPIWLFYTTHSPCRYCTDELVQGLLDERYKHIVVAFEGYYSPQDSDRIESGTLDLNSLRGMYRESYTQGRPGIEFFKLHCDQAISDDLRVRYRDAADQKEMYDELMRALQQHVALQRVVPAPIH